MGEKNNIPQIRFKKFEDNWKKLELFQIVDLRSGRDYKHLTSGNIPVYGTGGYMLSVNKALSYNEDAIGIGRKGTIDKPYILKAPFWTVDTLFYAVPRNHHSLDFIHAIFQNINWKHKDESTGVPSLSKVAINNITTYSTSINEQSQIGTYFQNLDKLITLQQQKHYKLVTLKKAMLDKMFPKEGADVPEVRFKGFEREWKEKKLGDVTHITTGKLDANAMKKDGKYDFYTSGIQKYKIDVYAFEGPAITIAGNGATVGYMHFANGLFNAYQRTYVLFDFTENREFLYFEISKVLPLKIKEEARSGNIPYIVLEMLTDLKIKTPSLKEQSQIGSFFHNLDKLISLQQQEIQKLKNIKKACLEKMFV